MLPNHLSFPQTAPATVIITRPLDLRLRLFCTHAEQIHSQTSIRGEYNVVDAVAPTENTLGESRPPLADEPPRHPTYAVARNKRRMALSLLACLHASRPLPTGCPPGPWLHIAPFALSKTIKARQHLKPRSRRSLHRFLTSLYPCMS